METITTLNGGRWKTATFRPKDSDPTITPPPEQVFLREPPLSKLGELMSLVGDIPAYVALLCGKSREWADGVTDDSLYELYEEGRKLNDPRFDRWMARQARTVETMTSQARKASDLQKLLPTQPSPSASPSQPSGDA